jgi:hypothetical protein
MSWKRFRATVKPRTVLLYWLCTASCMASLTMAYEGYSKGSYKHIQAEFRYVYLLILLLLLFPYRLRMAAENYGGGEQEGGGVKRRKDGKGEGPERLLRALGFGWEPLEKLVGASREVGGSF